MAEDSTNAGGKDHREHKKHTTLVDVVKARAGVGVAILRFFKRGSVMSAGNWGVLTFAGVAVVAKKLCHFQQAHQRAKVRTLLDMQSTVNQPKVKGFEPDSEPKPASSSDQ
ncbi:hypothetical protein GQ54DRAFT_301670 [Martensiomyces pterosporus]|nr:hypothetical protein GQ54DRAFT_301670 [Martensiomyces pterosporus]